MARGVILQVGIDAYGRVTLVSDCHQAGEQSILMSPVVGERQSPDHRIGSVQIADCAPCGVAASVVATHYVTVGRHQTVADHRSDDICQPCDSQRQCLLFVVAGDHYGQTCALA